MHSKTKQLLVKIAAIVFVLNTSFAHGACCVETQPEPTQPEQITSEQSTLPPCHQTDDAELDSTNVNCCVACVPVLPLTDLSAIHDAERLHFLPSMNIPVWASEVAQLFRPPISA